MSRRLRGFNIGLIIALAVLIVWEASVGKWGWVLLHSIGLVANVGVYQLLKWQERRRQEQERAALPTPPVNVKLILEDGSTRPLDCLYVGKSDGVHNWRTILTGPVPPNSFLHCDELPAHTALHSSWLVEPE